MKAQTAIPHVSIADSCRHSYMQEDLHADAYYGHTHHVDIPAHLLMPRDYHMDTHEYTHVVLPPSSLRLV